jgi:hypothetical protein
MCWESYCTIQHVGSHTLQCVGNHILQFVRSHILQCVGNHILQFVRSHILQCVGNHILQFVRSHILHGVFNSQLCVIPCDVLGITYRYICLVLRLSVRSVLTKVTLNVAKHCLYNYSVCSSALAGIIICIARAIVK